MKTWEKVLSLVLALLAAVVFLSMLAGSGAWEGFKDVVIAGVSFKEISTVLFEGYGPLLLILGALMFGAIIAGVTISKEEDDTDDSN